MTVNRFSVSIEGAVDHQFMPYLLARLLEVTPESGRLVVTLTSEPPEQESR